MADAVEAARELDRIRQEAYDAIYVHFEDGELDAFEAAIRADERARMQPETALRAAVQDLLAKDYGAYMSVGPGAKPEDEWDEYDYLVIPAWRALKAALDGAPYEPSEAEVERAAAGLAVAAGGQPAYMNWNGLARAALKAAWGGGGDD